MKFVKSQITSTKLQINLKFQYPMTKTTQIIRNQIDSATRLSSSKSVCDKLHLAIAGVQGDIGEKTFVAAEQPPAREGFGKAHGRRL